MERLIIAGWVLVTPLPRPAYAGSSLPERILTISGCLQEDVPYPDEGGWYTDLVEAELAHEQVPQARLLAVATAYEDADGFMRRFGEQDLEGFDLLRQRLAVDPDAVVLGHEIVGAEFPLDFHSWHCHGYADDVAEILGVHTNAYGLLATRAEALRALDWMLSRPPAQAPKDVPWTVVALTDAGLTHM